MAGVASQTPTGPNSSRSSSVVNGNAAMDYTNNHGPPPDSPASNAVPTPTNAAPVSKKAKGKKPVDDNEKAKLVAARLNQLELGAAEEKDQELEIESGPEKSNNIIWPFNLCYKDPAKREVRKATRDMTNLLAGIANPLERMDALQKRNTDLFAEMKRLERDHVKTKKRADQLQKEKDSSRSELSKTVGLRERLEKLCRELTRENKKMKEEHKKLEDTEKKSRELLSDRSEGYMWDLEDILEQKENPESQKLHQETDELFRQKCRSLIEQYELRELHFHSLSRTKECEVQWNLARYERQKKLADNEIARSRQLSSQVSTFSQTETELRSQLNIYVEKFKQEMEEMSKKTKRLEKENLNLTRKHDLTNRNILEMAEERTRITKEMDALRKKNNTLESVIRRMQDQGRGPPVGSTLDGDEEGTESDYDDDDYDEEEGSEEGEYDDDTEEELALQATTSGPPTFGPVPPPPTSVSIHVNGNKVNGVHGEVNGVNGVNGTK